MMELVALSLSHQELLTNIKEDSMFCSFNSSVSKLQSKPDYFNKEEIDNEVFENEFEEEQQSFVVPSHNDNSTLQPNMKALSTVAHITPQITPEQRMCVPVNLKEPVNRDKSQMEYLLNKLPDLANTFDLHHKIGEGTFSSVFLGTLKAAENVQTKKQFAIKHLVPTTLPSRTERELRCLQEIGGCDNVVGVDLCLRNGDCVVFIMPYLPHKRFSDYVLDLDADETREYMKNLLLSLRRVHSFNIIHRDIKPSNFLYDRDNRRFLLVDFGLSQSITSLSLDNTKTPVITEHHIKKRKRKEENSEEIIRNEKNLIRNIDSHDNKQKRMALHPLNERNIMQPERISQPIKKQRLGDGICFTSITAETMKHKYMKSPLKSQMVQSENRYPPHKSRTPGYKTGKSPCKSRTPQGSKSPYIKTGRSPYKSKIDLSIKKKLFSGSEATSTVPASPGFMKSPFASKQKFQMLVPDRAKVPNSGSSYVRVQNSQVKSHGPKPMSPLESEQQMKQIMFSKPSPKLSGSAQCSCSGKPQVCTVCMVRKAHAAPRAGTPGFRPPEVLLKHPHQTTAVDMWAGGVIMLCILSGCYPFFRSPDDVTALAEIMTVFGTDSIKKIAIYLGRTVLCSQHKAPLDLRKLCERLRRLRKERKSHQASGTPLPIRNFPLCPDCENPVEECDGCLCQKPNESPERYTGQFPASAYNLLERLLDLNPDSRITAAEALEHPFFAGK